MMHDVVYKLSEEDYLEGEKTSAIKYEYVAGEVFAMSGASKAHAAISLNIGSVLRVHLRGKPCRAYISDMKVCVKMHSAYYSRMWSVLARHATLRPMHQPIISKRPS